MTPDEIHIEPVQGARWVVAWHPDSSHIIPVPELPPYASPALAEAWRDSLAADVSQHCGRCNAVADVPPAVKTAPPNTTFISTNKVPHTLDCPCGDEALDVLERECSPFGAVEQADLSDEAITKLCAHLTRIETQLRAAAAPTETSSPEGGTNALP